MVSETSPRCRPDILERAKASAENIERYAYDCDFEEARLVTLALIAEVEAKNDKIAQDAITIQMHHGNVLTLQKEVERLRSKIVGLEAAMVEERANLILEKIRDGSIITLQGPDERRANAILQLQAEGKIGGGDGE